MALHKTRPVAAFLLLVTIGSLLTTSEGVKLSEGAFRQLSKKARSAVPKVNPSATGAGNNVRNMAAAWDKQIEEGDGKSPAQAAAAGVREPVWATGKVKAAAKDPTLLAAAKKLAHKSGGVFLTRPQIHAMVMDAATKTVEQMDPRAYENMSEEVAEGYEQARKDFEQMPIEQKAAMLAKVTRDRSFLGRVRDKFFRQKFEVQKQMMMAAQHLNEDRGSDGKLNRGAVARAIKFANDNYQAPPEEKEEDNKPGQQSDKL